MPHGGARCWAPISPASPAGVTETAQGPDNHPTAETKAEAQIDATHGSGKSDIPPGTADTPAPDSDRRSHDSPERALGDFTTTRTILPLVPLAVVIGVLGAGISLALLDMIGFFTNLFYFQRLSVHLVSPYGNTLGVIAVVIPIGGGLIVGLMARFGSEQIRGHGIPEAMERILINGSKVQPRLAILKPISSAISIGTGGPFGAEGPIRPATRTLTPKAPYCLPALPIVPTAQPRRRSDLGPRGTERRLHKLQPLREALLIGLFRKPNGLRERPSSDGARVNGCPQTPPANGPGDGGG